MQIKRSHKTIIAVEIAFLAMFLISGLLIGAEIELRLIYWVVALAILASFSVWTLGFRQDNNYLRGPISRLVLCIFAFVGLLLLVVGTFVGINFVEFHWSALLFAAFALSLELFRYALLANHRENRKLNVYFVLISVAVQFITVVNFTTLYTTGLQNVVIFTTLLPIVANEVVCHALSLRVSVIPAIIYRLGIVLAPQILPYQPNLGPTLQFIFALATPIIAFLLISHHLAFAERHHKRARHFSITFFTAPIILILAAYAVLASGLAPLQMISIASNSMLPTFARGDAVIFSKNSEIRPNDILVFKRGNQTIVHRVIEIVDEHGERYYRTQGDANPQPDDYLVNAADVLGRVEIVYHYVGYPALLINEAFQAEE